LSEWSGIVIASGDGVVYEVNNSISYDVNNLFILKVINGLFSRNDWQEALKLPIGHLPCGSANAFVTNIIRHSK
jgi:sphingosine kinase